MPVLLVGLYHQILEQDIKTYNHYSWTETLAFLNSCTNPLLCFWKNRQIRQGVVAMGRRITWHLANNDENVKEVGKKGCSKSVTLWRYAGEINTANTAENMTTSTI